MACRGAGPPWKSLPMSKSLFCRVKELRRPEMVGGPAVTVLFCPLWYCFGSVATTDSEELKKFTAIREAMYLKAKVSESEIIGFEMGIEMSNFVQKCLPDEELKNWHNHLDDIEKGDEIVERCVPKLSRILDSLCSKHGSTWTYGTSVGCPCLSNSSLCRERTKDSFFCC